MSGRPREETSFIVGKYSQPIAYISLTVVEMERSGDKISGGGLAIVYREALPAHHWTPTVPELQYVSKERQWILIDNKPQRCAFLYVYVACQTTMERRSAFDNTEGNFNKKVGFGCHHNLQL